MTAKGNLKAIILTASVVVIGAIVLVVVALPSMIKFDRGVEYRPRDWESLDTGRLSRSFGALDIKLRPIGGLIGNKDISPELTITNRGNLPAIVEKAVLRAGGLEHVAQPFGDKKWVTILPGTNRGIDIKWEFDNYIDEILKDPVEIDLTIKLGDENTEIKIPMVKTPG